MKHQIRDHAVLNMLFCYYIYIVVEFLGLVRMILLRITAVAEKNWHENDKASLVRPPKKRPSRKYKLYIIIPGTITWPPSLKPN